MAGAAMTVSNTAANTLVQTTAHPRMLGRTVSLYMLAMRGGASLGSIATGAAISWFGVRAALLVNGVLAIAVQGAVGILWAKARLPDQSLSADAARASS
jgi:MFS family permease